VTGGHNASQSATPQGTSSSLTISPGSISLDPRLERQQVEVTLAAKVSPANTRSQFSIELPAAVGRGITLKGTLVDSAQANMSEAGMPTGEVSQQLLLDFGNIPARLDTISIPMRLRFGQLTQTAVLSATNVSTLPTGASLLIEAPSEQNWWASGAIPIVVSAKGAAAPRISLGAGPFVDAEHKNSLGSDFCLAPSEHTECQGDVSLDANEQRTLWLKGTGTSARPGTYVGTLRLVARNGLEGSKSITLLVTSGGWQVAGLLALLAGVVASWILTKLLPHLRNRDASLVPFARLGERLSEIEDRISGFKAQRVSATLGTIRASNSTRWLVEKRLLAGWWPSPDPYSGAEELKSHLDSQTKAVAGLERLAEAFRIASKEQVVRLDALVREDFPPFDLEEKISAILNPGVRTVARDEANEPPSLGMIVLREAAHNAAFWIVSSFLSVALGYVLLVDGNPAFGGWRDVLAALLWGLGLSSAGSKLSELTAGQVITTLQPATPAGKQA
jgi:hypothetical protein